MAFFLTRWNFASVSTVSFGSSLINLVVENLGVFWFLICTLRCRWWRSWHWMIGEMLVVTKLIYLVVEILVVFWSLIRTLWPGAVVFFYWFVWGGGVVVGGGGGFSGDCGDSGGSGSMVGCLWWCGEVRAAIVWICVVFRDQLEPHNGLIVTA